MYSSDLALDSVRESLPEMWKMGAAAVGLLAVGSLATWAVTNGPLSRRR